MIVMCMLSVSLKIIKYQYDLLASHPYVTHTSPSCTVLLRCLLQTVAGSMHVEKNGHEYSCFLGSPIGLRLLPIFSFTSRQSVFTHEGSCDFGLKRVESDKGRTV